MARNQARVVQVTDYESLLYHVYAFTQAYPETVSATYFRTFGEGAYIELTFKENGDQKMVILKCANNTAMVDFAHRLASDGFLRFGHGESDGTLYPYRIRDSLDKNHDLKQRAERQAAREDQDKRLAATTESRRFLLALILPLFIALLSMALSLWQYVHSAGRDARLAELQRQVQRVTQGATSRPTTRAQP